MLGSPYSRQEAAENTELKGCDEWQAVTVLGGADASLAKGCMCSWEKWQCRPVFGTGRKEKSSQFQPPNRQFRLYLHGKWKLFGNLLRE